MYYPIIPSPTFDMPVMLLLGRCGSVWAHYNELSPAVDNGPSAQSALVSAPSPHKTSLLTN